jgi:COMPASS component SPP1
MVEHPHLHSTFKVACSFTSCRKPARLPLSKFCSDECGISCVMERVDQWSALESAQAEVNGLAQGPEPWERLHECSAIRQAKRREGIVVVDAEDYVFSGGARDGKHEEDKRTAEKYQEIVAKIRMQRDEKLRNVAIVHARLLLMSMAIERCEFLGAGGICGFDRRVMMDHEDWIDWVESEDGRLAFEGTGQEGQEEDAGELQKWLCQGKKKCDRHTGWQKSKMADFELEKDVLVSIPHCFA